MSPVFSIVIPVYNRPEEIAELLKTLSLQTFKGFEVIIVEDGSSIPCKHLLDDFKNDLQIKYFFKENEGQGFARNYGFERSEGEIIVIFDSDCLIPAHYLQTVHDFLKKNDVDVYGGPDAAHESFNLVQKAINLSMTSFLTTGGIRGKKNHVGKYHPRSFNMGFRREVYDETGGYIIPFMGEDIEFAVRVIKKGFKSVLIPDAYVYHKRRTSLLKFFKQLKYFGRARINLSRFHSGEVKLTHLFPLAFSIGLVVSLVLSLFNLSLGYLGAFFYAIYFIILFIEALIKTASIPVSFLVVPTALLQFFGYGYGLCYEWLRKASGINPNTKYTELY